MIALFFAAFLWAALYYRLARYKLKRQESYLLAQNRPHSIPQRSYFTFSVRVICLVTAWALLALCLMRPVEDERQAPAAKSAAGGQLPKVDEIAFVLDLSASMGCKDTSDGSSRLERAKELIDTMMEELGGINVSLLGFTENSLMLVPETLDYLYFRILLDAARINDTGTPGTNLMTMCDAVKAHYVQSPYRESVRVILLTDGEDTGFLDLDPAALQQAENALLAQVASTVSGTLQWEVVGMGSTQGAVVPGVAYDGQAVTSHMKSDLLQRFAAKGSGHFYAESAVPLLEICDNLLADIAGARTEGPHPTNGLTNAPTSALANMQAPKLTWETWLLLAIATLLVLASIALPEHEKGVQMA